MQYQIQINVDEEKVAFTTPQIQITQEMHGLPEEMQQAILEHESSLSPEQQEHLGNLFFLLSNGIVNEEIQQSLELASLGTAAATWQKHEYDKHVSRVMMEDVISPHEALSPNQQRTSYSAEKQKPDKIKMEFRPVDMKARSFKQNFGEVFDDSIFFGFATLFEMNTNFRLTKGLLNDFIPVDGVEVVHPMSRYKVLIGFGEMFENGDEWEDVKFNLRKIVEEYFR